ncbi:MotB family protein [Roseibium denhamense]|nr:MotB family protein [Roseibium denhamense]
MLDGVPNEIVIVRRKNSWEDTDQTHGVWKIAYADFMTALMAFFLVMWLINVTDDSVRRGVAQYFNPVKLASTAPNRKGLNDPQINGDTNENGTKLFTGKLGGSEEPVDQDANFGDGHESGHRAQEVQETPQTGGVNDAGQFTQIHSESILFSDPYAVLDTLSEKIRVVASTQDNPTGIGTGLQKHEGSQGGQAYRDPFDPLYWQFRPGRGVDGSETVSAGLPDAGADPVDESGRGPSDVDLAGENAWGAPFDTPASQDDGSSLSAANGTGDRTNSGAGPTDYAYMDSGSTEEELEADEAIIAHVSGSLAAGAEATGEDGAAAPSQAEMLVARLQEVLEAADGTALEQTASQITITREGEGALISLTDDQSFGMFAIGSAEPRPELVKLLENIAAIVADAPGRIVIKGHTDARPFKSTTYDNWRLSTARAHMALYMLNRGGVPKERFDRVEGYADRDLKIPADPYAAPNRRVEIYLLEGEGE